MNKILTPEELALKFIDISETSTDEQKIAAEQLITLINQVSKVRLQEVFTALDDLTIGDCIMWEDMIKLRKKYEKNGTLFNDDMELVNLEEKSNMETPFNKKMNLLRELQDNRDITVFVFTNNDDAYLSFSKLNELDPNKTWQFSQSDYLKELARPLSRDAICIYLP